MTARRLTRTGIATFCTLLVLAGCGGGAPAGASAAAVDDTTAELADLGLIFPAATETLNECGTNPDSPAWTTTAALDAGVDPDVLTSTVADQWRDQGVSVDVYPDDGVFAGPFVYGETSDGHRYTMRITDPAGNGNLNVTIVVQQACAGE